MGKNARLSRDQKRKAKLARRPDRPGSKSVLAYEGKKYRSDELVPVVFRTEVAIYEADEMQDRCLTDRTVQAALENLVRQMRAGPLPPLEQTTDVIEVKTGAEEDFLIWNIRRNWQILFEEDNEPHPGKDNLIGVLRTLLNSMHFWGSPSPQSRGYLAFVEGFVTKSGASIQKYRHEGDNLIPVEPADEDELLLIGREWCFDGDKEAADDFRARAQDMIAKGQAERVFEICQQLMGEIADTRYPLTELRAIAIAAQKAMRALPG